MELTFDANELFQKIEICEELFIRSEQEDAVSPVHRGAYKHILTIKNRLEIYKPTTVSLDEYDMEALERLWNL